MNNFVIWGGHKDLSSHRHIHRHFYETTRKLGIPSVWCEDEEESQKYLEPGATVLAIDIWSDFIVYKPGVQYVTHNFDGSHQLFQDAPPEAILRLQVWTDDAFGEKWADCRAYDYDGRILFQPWGTDLLAEEFMEPTVNMTTRECSFVGAIWGEKTPYGELGNMAAIQELEAALTSRGLRLSKLTHVPDRANVNAVRMARLAPSIAGAWQVEHGYLPCRCFKNPSYGVLMFTNIPAVQKLFGESAVPGETIDELVENALKLKTKDYLELVYAQQRVVARYTYREALEAITLALEFGRG